ncbi:MAG: hydrolase [Firmicutes bacterium HGW-Firmicutes-3]|nr:MAG: hydrolase [Firmicutes bacterium HGW-Firmicutes-3]
MRYLADVNEGDQIVDIYLCAEKQVLNGKIWDLNDGINSFGTGDYIKVDATVVSFQGSIQYNIKRVRVAQEGEYDPKDYVPATEYDVEEMYKEFVGYIEDMDDPWLKQLASNFFIEDKAFAKSFKAHTAAKTVHHAYMGGLLEHTLYMLRLCDFMTKQYPVLNKSILFSGCMFHDIGKLKELSEFPIIEYTDEGQLVGHIIIGIEWLSKKIDEIPKFPPTLANLLKHMIIAHHGELEYGSPKKPELIEAIALHYIDNIDAKMKTFTTLMKASSEQDDWLGYQRMFESNLRRTRY